MILGFNTSAQQKNSTTGTINLQDLIGKWKPTKVSPTNFFQSNLTKPISHPDTSRGKAVTPKTGNKSQPDQNKRLELKTTAHSIRSLTLEFLADNNATKTYPDKTDKYSWKKKKKNILVFKNLTTNEKNNIEIFKLNSDTLQVEEHLTSGNLYVFYLKVK